MKNYLDKLWFRIFLVAIASVYITELGSIDSYATRIRTWDFYKEYLATTVISFTVFELIYFINTRLNKRIPWKDQVMHRLLLQVIIGWITPLFLVFGMASLYFLMFGVNIMKTDYLYYAFPFVVFMVLLINILFVMTPCFLEVIGPEKSRILELLPPSVTLVKVQDGYKVKMLETTKIAAAYIINKKMLIRHINDREYMTDLTLDELENHYLPAQDFYRINRQLIASRAFCTEYQPSSNNKLQVSLSVSVPVDTSVSHMKAKRFKEWIDGQKYTKKKSS